MKVIGLTGGIGTGKSSVAAILRDMGVTVIDADEATRAVQAPGTPGLRALVAEFGEAILRPDGSLDRERLAGIAFADDAARRRLNGIVHPLVRHWMAERQAEAEERGERFAVLDIPLLFEARDASAFPAVVLVYAPEEVQVRRLVEQRGMSEEQARARIDAQMPIEEKRSRTPYVIVNTGSLEDLRAQVERVWSEVTAAAGSGP